MSKYEKTIVVGMNKELWERLRQAAFDNRISMNLIARSGIEEMLKKLEKNSKKKN